MYCGGLLLRLIFLRLVIAVGVGVGLELDPSPKEEERTKERNILLATTNIGRTGGRASLVGENEKDGTAG